MIASDYCTDSPNFEHNSLATWSHQVSTIEGHVLGIGQANRASLQSNIYKDHINHSIQAILVTIWNNRQITRDKDSISFRVYFFGCIWRAYLISEIWWMFVTWFWSSCELLVDGNPVCDTDVVYGTGGGLGTISLALPVTRLCPQIEVISNACIGSDNL